ncbi:protein SODIUM POTASSIUM ROOT DEFECTIVE 2-like protein [Cinnamomum micranthum f. kanehirae]|uniref:Protein SODIUM POTASSIUM ROOT DEFECTIVE 2-like protein n=1 Tax=Cinnamomum micranthum f. kanehirae TaxID=337451 RepID=A0A3S3MNF0_9MAGN|nr:protein SODIUM POTASSIUM ROOT DEFECTIVE 2-like protein [Cinnamomum micranthum f. kanehirae]
MKGIDLFCASPASTAICVSMDHRSMVRHGSRVIDRQNPRLMERRRTKQTNTNPYSQSTAKVKPDHQKSRKSSAKQTELTSPPGSSRYLLSDSPFFDVAPQDQFDPVPVLSLVPIEPTVSLPIKKDESSIFKSSSTRSHDQVVVLRVSLHCKGCEAKVRKHISRMQGVTSFNIDFPAKKVTVIGNVTPLGVLASISKVKNAEFWPSSSLPRSPSSSIS